MLWRCGRLAAVLRVRGEVRELAQDSLVVTVSCCVRSGFVSSARVHSDRTEPSDIGRAVLVASLFRCVLGQSETFVDRGSDRRGCSQGRGMALVAAINASADAARVGVCDLGFHRIEHKPGKYPGRPDRQGRHPVLCPDDRGRAGSGFPL